MENPNTEGKPLSDLVKEAEEKKMQIILIGVGEEGSLVKHALASEKMMAVRIETLPESDQEKLAQAKKENLFEKPPIPFVMQKHEPIPEVFLSAEKDLIFRGHKRKKLKGYQKKR